MIRALHTVTMFSIIFNLIKLNKSYRSLRYISVSKSCQKHFRHIDEVVPKNTLEGFQNNMALENGTVYESRPFKLLLKKDKLYAWCLCGHSKSQPLCDCTHKIIELNIKQRPIFFKVGETKDYWLCNCKQTKHRPFCDGSHVPIQEQERKKEQEKSELLEKKK